jgi:predicted O-methyltransferase YrrM
MTAVDALDIVPVATLHERLGWTEPLVYPIESQQRSFLDWKMEVDDSPILRYLYRQLQPRRHLEFGTWSGRGACYCLEHTRASVWTINLPNGEFIDGKPAYSEAVDHGFRQTDSGALIGARYREAGFGHRVCQIYCDSRDWDTSPYLAGFFDSVLIDGGHTADVVLSDTRKALSVTRPGGLIMWHDFCPDPVVFDHFPSVTGVLDALTGHWEEFAPQLRDVFWVQPSFLLVGVRGNDHEPRALAEHQEGESS